MVPGKIPMLKLSFLMKIYYVELHYTFYCLSKGHLFFIVIYTNTACDRVTKYQVSELYLHVATSSKVHSPYHLS